MPHSEDNTYKEQFDLLSYSTNEYEQSVSFIQESILPHLPSRQHFLDIGAGSGNLTKPLAPAFQQSSFVEPNQMYYEELLQWGNSNGQALAGYHGDWLDYDFQGQADLVVMSHVLYFVPQAKRSAFIKKAYASVKDGGYLIITVISATSGISHLYRGLLAPEVYATMPSIEDTLVKMHAEGYEQMRLKLFDAVIQIPNKASMDYLIDFLIMENITSPKAMQERDAYIERYLQNDTAYSINSNIGLLILKK